MVEEVSKEGHYWTSLHYACHYGHYHIVEYILSYLNEHMPEQFTEIVNLQTIEGKTPLFCAMLSGDIKDFTLKKRIIKLLFETDCINVLLRKQTGEDMLALAKKN